MNRSITPEDFCRDMRGALSNIMNRINRLSHMNRFPPSSPTGECSRMSYQPSRMTENYSLKSEAYTPKRRDIVETKVT